MAEHLSQSGATDGPPTGEVILEFSFDAVIRPGPTLPHQGAQVKRLIILATVIAAFAIPAAAHANLSVYNCTAGPYKPAFTGSSATYNVYVTCPAGTYYLLNWQLQELFGSNWIIVRNTTQSSGVVTGSRWWTGSYSPTDPGHLYRTAITKFQVNPAGTGWFSADISNGGTAAGSDSGGTTAP